MSDKLGDVLDRLDRHWATRGESGLRPPASPQALDKLARHWRRHGGLPESMRHLLGWHDGQEAGCSLWPDSIWRLLPATEIVAHSEALVRNYESWNERWIPFATNDNSDYMIAWATTGQAAYFFHDENPPDSAAEPFEYFVASAILTEWGDPEPPSGLELDR